MRVCLVTHTFRLTDGQGRVNLEVGVYLARQGHQVTMVSTTIDQALLDEPNITWREVAIPKWVRGNLLRHQVFALKSRQVIRREPKPFDVLHLNGFISYLRGDANASHFVHADWVRSPYHTARIQRGWYGVYQRLVAGVGQFLERRAYHAAPRVIAVSDKVRDSLIDYVDVDPAKITVIPNGVDIDEFRPLPAGAPNPLRQELGLPDSAFLVFYAGDLKTTRKNCELVLRGVAALGPEFHVVCAGNAAGSPYPALAKSLGLDGRAHFLGSRKDLPRIAPGADAYFCASHYDPSSLVMLEGMASGVPTITAPSVGNAVLVEQGVNGFVLRDSVDRDGLVDVLRRLAADRAYARAVGARGRLTAESRSWKAMARHYERVYEEIAAAHRRPILEPVG